MMNCSSAMAFPSVWLAQSSFALPCSESTRRTRSDRNRRSGESKATRRLPLIEAADRGDLRVALAARQQRRRRIDRRRDRRGGFRGCDRRPRRRRHSPSKAPRPCRARRGSLSAGKPSSARNETSGSSRSRSVTTPSTAVSDARHLGNMLRQLDDLAHAIERQRIFLAARVEADQRAPAAARATAARADAAAASDAGVRGARTGNAEPAEFVAQQPLRIQDLDRAFAFGALDDAVQKIRIERAGAGVVLLDLRRPEAPADARSDRRQIRPARRRRSR